MQLFKRVEGKGSHFANPPKGSSAEPREEKHACTCEEKLTLSSQNKFTGARMNTIIASLDDLHGGCGSPVSDGLGLCFSFNPYLRKSLLSQNEGLKLVWIVNVYRRSFSRATANAIDTSENKITIGPGKADDTLQHDKDKAVMYNGPISETIRRVKLLSLSTCCLSVSLGPVITFLTSPGLNVIVKGAVASCVIFISASTTAALHWFASPYVHKLRWQPGADSFEVEVLSWLATYVPRTIKFSDVKPPQTNRPYVTFKANGNFYFIDAERCQNKALLAKLTPKEPSTTSTVKNL
eukprot:Gb_33329 [translate_table: standard]